MNMPLFPIHQDDTDVGQLGDAVPYGYERVIHVAVGLPFIFVGIALAAFGWPPARGRDR
jgi:hypothetical protein